TGGGRAQQHAASGEATVLLEPVAEALDATIEHLVTSRQRQAGRLRQRPPAVDGELDHRAGGLDHAPPNHSPLARPPALADPRPGPRQVPRRLARPGRRGAPPLGSRPAFPLALRGAKPAHRRLRQPPEPGLRACPDELVQQLGPSPARTRVTTLTYPL